MPRTAKAGVGSGNSTSLAWASWGKIAICDALGALRISENQCKIAQYPVHIFSILPIALKVDINKSGLFDQNALLVRHLPTLKRAPFEGPCETRWLVSQIFGIKRLDSEALQWLKCTKVHKTIHKIQKAFWCFLMFSVAVFPRCSIHQVSLDYIHCHVQSSNCMFQYDSISILIATRALLAGDATTWFPSHRL